MVLKVSLYLAGFSIYGLVCLFLLAITFGFGVRIHQTMYADQSILLRFLSGLSLILLLLGGLLFISKKLVR